MIWRKIRSRDAREWNQVLKETNASFFQYPYYAKGYKTMLFLAAEYLELSNCDGIALGFCSILKINLLFFKIGLIIRGPVIFSPKVDTSLILNALKKYAKSAGYTFIRINPNEESLEKILAHDTDFLKKDYFPVYKGSQGMDFNVVNKPKDLLLQSFRPTCRHKIRYQQELEYTYKQLESSEELKEVYKLFKKVGKSKDFSFRPYNSYKSIFSEGLTNGLCSVYVAELMGEMICAAFIVKDTDSYTYFSGALNLGEINPKYSPANNLHYLIMQDCFYKDSMKKYNLSYSSPGSGTYIFKSSFRPVLDVKPGYYTYLINEKKANFLYGLQTGSIKKLRSFLRKVIRTFTL